MKINRIFHYLYCFLMGLPILIAPIFAIMVWSDNNYQPITITTSGYEIRNKFETNVVNDNDDIIEGNIYHLYFTGTIDNYIDYDDNPEYITFQILHFNDYDFGEYDFLEDYEFYVLHEYGTGDIAVYIDFSSDYVGSLSVWFIDNDENYPFYRCYLNFSDYSFILNCEAVVTYKTDNLEFGDISCITSSTYEVLDYVYNEGIVYDDTDIGSQLVYSLYKPLNEYFNFNKVQFFNGIYEWLTSWIFNGNPPLVFYIIWELLCYWLLVSIIWLVYDVLMYVPLLAHRWLDKGVIS